MELPMPVPASSLNFWHMKPVVKSYGWVYQHVTMIRDCVSTSILQLIQSHHLTKKTITDLCPFQQGNSSLPRKPLKLILQLGAFCKHPLKIPYELHHDVTT